MNAVEISTLGIVVVILLVAIIVWYKTRDDQKQPECVFRQHRQNLSTELRLPPVKPDGTLSSECRIVPPTENILVFRSQMWIQTSPSQQAPESRSTGTAPSIAENGQTKTLWNFPELGKGRDPKVVTQIEPLFPPDGGLQRFDAAQPTKTNEGVTGAPTQPQYPWPPLASAQLISQYNTPQLNPNSPTNRLQQNGNPTFITTENGVQNPGTQIPNWNDPNLPSNAQREQPRNGARAFVRIAGINDASGLEAYSTVNGSNTILTALSMYFLHSGTVYVECAGGNGGSFFTGSPKDKNLVKQVGGRNGIVWAFIQVRKGDTWQVQLSQDGQEQPRTVAAIRAEIPASQSKVSGGGYGSFLSGSEGGGATWISTEPPCFSSQARKNCPEIGKSHHEVLMVAGGGGGASRNAQGGDAGCAMVGATQQAVNPNPNLSGAVRLKNHKHPNPIYQGFPGGPVNVPNPESESLYAPVQQSSLINGLSGGGGGQTNSSFGESWNVVGLPFVQKELRGPAKEESKGKPLQGGQGTDDPPGGGGGGAGWKGGGAGIWNQLAAPNNVHGAGGGGSSFVSSKISLSSSAEKLTVVNQNPYQADNWQRDFQNPKNTKSTTGGAVQGLIFEPSNQFMLAVPTVLTQN